MSRTLLRSGRRPEPLSAGASASGPGRARRLLRAAAAAAATAASVLAVGLFVRDAWEPLVRFDERTVHAAVRFASQHPALVDALNAWQWAFEGRRIVVVVVGACLLVWWRTGMKTRTWWALATALGAWGFANLAKEVARLARPVLDEPLSHASGYSFPSGHASTTAAWSTVLVVLVWPLLRTRAAKALAVTGTGLLVVLTALDRVLLGAHFPSDVLAGTVLGVGLVLASYLGYRGWSPDDSAPTGSSVHSTQEAR
ncbi:phosphatase PAP2 family protein [Cellulomonas persica]|nr:phosphatase PAP2 family protein [Cellulomonas persica]